MIVELLRLQAFQCTVCERIYELDRNHGHEDALNRKLDFKRRLQVRHSGCVPKEVVAAMPAQGRLQ